MPKAVWYVRWHIARVMIHTALRIAPAGPARKALEEYLNAYGRMVVSALSKARS